jgi:hypothetical protein
MSQGSAPRQGDAFRDTSEFCGSLVGPDSIYQTDIVVECPAADEAAFAGPFVARTLREVRRPGAPSIEPCGPTARGGSPGS